MIRKLQGKTPILSEMEDTWCGDSIRYAKPHQRWPELFLYSKTDTYLPYKTLEQNVINPHRENGRDVSTKCWDKSPHVGHLKAHPKEYKEVVHDFLYKHYFSTI